MNDAAFAILAAVVAALILNGLVTRAGMLQLPFLAAATTAGWFLPQAYGLLSDVFLPAGGYALTMLYAAACLVALAVGWSRVRPSARFAAPVYDGNRLLLGAGVLSAIGLVAHTQIFNIDVELTEEGLSTGLVTVLYFFAKLQYFGLAIALMLLLRRFSWIALAIVVIDLNTVLGFVLHGGRRGPAAFMVLIVLTALWFDRRILIPRAALVAGLVVGALLVNSIGSYRRLTETLERLPTVEELLAIDFFAQSTGQGENFEGRNAIVYINSSFVSSNYDFGALYWNFFVFSYVPAQFVGRATKDALTLPTRDNSVDVYGYKRHIGTTFTGFADSFISFSVLGVFVFAAMGALMRRWWNEAMLGGMRGKLLYAINIATALHGVTHSTQWFFVFVSQALLFVLPVLLLARTGTRPALLRSASPQRAPRARRRQPYLNLRARPF